MDRSRIKEIPFSRSAGKEAICRRVDTYYWGLYPKQAQKKISVIAIEEYKYPR